MGATHTAIPGPYEVFAPGRVFIKSVRNFRAIAELETYDRDPEQVLATAEFIVRAANSHDALVAACRESLAMVDEAYQATGYSKVAKTSEQRLRIEAALASAGEPGEGGGK